MRRDASLRPGETRVGPHRAARARAAVARRPVHHPHVFAGRDDWRRRGAGYGGRSLSQGGRRSGAAGDIGSARRARAHRSAGAGSAYGLGMAELVARTGMPRERRSPPRQPRLVAGKQPQSWLRDRAWFDSAREQPGESACASFTSSIRCCPAFRSRICAGGSCRTRRRSSSMRCWPARRRSWWTARTCGWRGARWC